MPETENAVPVAAEWVAKAENDLKNAAHTLKLGRECPTDTVCFHAQQCVEKYLKAYLAFRGLDFPKIHDVEELISLLPPQARPNLNAEEQAQLSQYAVRPRYPGWPEISLSDARKAVALARRVRKNLRSLLPKEALRRKKR